MAKVKTGYKQNIEFVNTFPKKTLHNFKEISALITTRYNSNAKKTDNIEEFMKRKVRYLFCVYFKSNTIVPLPSHTYIFSNEEKAIEAYKYCMRKWIDEQIEPYRKLVEKGKTLTLAQIEKCEKIQNLLPDD